MRTLVSKGSSNRQQEVYFLTSGVNFLLASDRKIIALSFRDGSDNLKTLQKRKIALTVAVKIAHSVFLKVNLSLIKQAIYDLLLDIGR